LLQVIFNQVERLRTRAYPAIRTIAAIDPYRSISFKDNCPIIVPVWVVVLVAEEVVLEEVVVVVVVVDGSGAFQPANIALSHQKARPFCSQLVYVV
jgi:hypothetical protein